MESHHAATNGIQALSIQSEQVQSAPHTSDSNDDRTVQDASSRKRQKVTHLTTMPLPADRQTYTSVHIASGRSFGTHVEPVGGEFDYLLHWQQADDGVVDDDDLIGEDDEDDDGSEEVEEEEANGRRQEDIEVLPAAPGRTKLNEAQIVDIINDCIDEHAAAWRPNKDVLKDDEVNYDAEEMWLTAERDGTRHELVKRYEVDVAYYTQRLNKLCDEILRAPGSNVKDVKQQCRHLEVTIDSIELADWLLSIYRLDPTDDEDDDENVVHEDTPGSTERPSALQIPRRRVTEVIDLGSPPASDEDGMIVDSSPAPEIPISRAFYTPDSVIGESIAADSVVPDSAFPGSAIEDSVLGDSMVGEPAIIDTIESTKPPTPKHETRGLAVSGALASSSLKSAQPEAARHPAPRQKREVKYSDSPQDASMLSSRRWKWEELVRTHDRKRIVTRAIQEMGIDDFESMRHRLATVGKADIIREISVCVQMLAKGGTRMPGVLARDFTKIVTFARLFLCWWLCDNYFRAEPSKWDLEELQKCLREQSPDPSVFYDYVQTVMNSTFSTEAMRHPERPSQAEIIDLISDDEDPGTQPCQPRRPNQTHRPGYAEPGAAIIID